MRSNKFRTSLQAKILLLLITLINMKLFYSQDLRYETIVAEKTASICGKSYIRDTCNLNYSLVLGNENIKEFFNIKDNFSFTWKKHYKNLKMKGILIKDINVSIEDVENKNKCIHKSKIIQKKEINYKQEQKKDIEWSLVSKSDKVLISSFPIVDYHYIFIVYEINVENAKEVELTEYEKSRGFE